MAGRIAPPARPPSGLTYFINVARTLSHLCTDAVNGSDQLLLLKISQTRGLAHLFRRSRKKRQSRRMKPSGMNGG